MSAELRREFLEMTGFLLRNMECIHSFAEAFSEESIVQQIVAQLPYRHNLCKRH